VLEICNSLNKQLIYVINKSSHPPFFKKSPQTHSVWGAKKFIEFFERWIKKSFQNRRFL